MEKEVGDDDTVCAAIYWKNKPYPLFKGKYFN